MSDKDELVRMYESTEETLEALFAKADDESLSEEVRDEATREAYDRVYGIGTRKVIRLTLAGGGPGAWLDVTVVDKEITEVEWVGVSWGDRVERSIDRDTPMWRLAEYHVEGWE
jgi:hypothetical protein